MPIEPVAEAAIQAVAEGVVQATGEIAGDKIQRRFGWQGCILSALALAAVVGLFVYLG